MFRGKSLYSFAAKKYTPFHPISSFAHCKISGVCYFQKVLGDIEIAQRLKQEEEESQVG